MALEKLMNAIQEAKAKRTPGTRFAIAMASWTFAGIGILTSLMFAGAGVVSSSARGILALTPLLAWISLGVMTVRWVQGHYCHWLWPIIGFITGAISAVMFTAVFFFYISAVPLAVYLVFWHLRGNMRSSHVSN
ncbi:MAG: hypothetical protein H7293_06265 [Candidatus Saccharibacteria bacterium]|nr:hypothetical protein [Rhodoferax sp.]